MTGATLGADVEPRAGQPSRGRRVQNVDVLRAVAALSVLAVHAYDLGGRIAPIKARVWYDVPLITLSSGVWLFFGISGYVISKPFVDRMLAGRPPPAFVPYALRRALRIFPLYWIALGAVIAIDGVGATRPWQLIFHVLLLNNLVPGRQEALFPVAWTLTLEVLFYVSLPVLVALVQVGKREMDGDRLARLLLLSWAASIAFTALGDLKGDDRIGLWLRGSLPAMWQMFCPGILLAIAPHVKMTRLRSLIVEVPRRRGGLIAAGLTLVAASILGSAAPLRFGVVVYQLLVDASRPLFAVGFGILIARAIRAPAWRVKWALTLGIASYGIYLLHPVIAALLTREGIAPIPHDSLPAFLVNALCLAALTIPLAIASWNWIESPAIRLGRGLGRRWT